MASTNYTFLLSLSIIVLGYVLKISNILTEEHGKTFAKLIINVTLPAIILDNVPYIEFNTSIISIVFMSFLYSLLMTAIWWRHFRKFPNKERGIMQMLIIGLNIGNFVFPIIDSIWGQDGLQYAIMFDIGNAFVIFGLCYLIGGLFSPKLKESADNDNDNDNVNVNDKENNASAQSMKNVVKMMFRSIPLLCYIFGTILNIAGLLLPEFVRDVVGIVADANPAIVLLTLGIFLNFKFESSQWAIIFKVLVIRYSFGLIAGLCMYYLLPSQFTSLAKLIIAIMFILPLSMGTLTFCVEFGYDERVAGTMANISIIISFALMWILILILN